MADRVVFHDAELTRPAAATLFLAAIWLGFRRLLFLVRRVAAQPPARIAHAYRPRLPDDPPLQSVLIPAYNEEKVIAATVATSWPATIRNLEVIVIDDGSQGRHARGVLRTSLRDDPRVRLIAITNGGKAHALNSGLRKRGAAWSWRSMPTPISSATPSAIWCAGSPIRKSAPSPAMPRSATAST